MSGTPTRFRIVDEAGRPLAGALLTVARSSVPFPEIALAADDGGVVQLTLPDGEFTFRAFAGARTGEATVTGARGGEVVLRVAP